jgi:hypothetical protein
MTAWIVRWARGMLAGFELTPTVPLVRSESPALTDAGCEQGTPLSLAAAYAMAGARAGASAKS